LASAGRDTHLFQTFNWNWHWANHYLSAAQPAATPLAIVTAHRQGRLIGLWPLVLVASGGLKVLRWMGEPVSQYGDVLIAKLPDKAAVLRQCWRYIVDHLGAPSLSDARFTAFFADVAEARRRPAGCAVTTMRCNGVIASIAIDVTTAGRRAAHMIVHDRAFQRLSPGTLLLQEWIRAASAEGIATFDLLAPAYAYKDEWPMPASRWATMRAASAGQVGPTPASISPACAPAKAALEALPHLVARTRAYWPVRPAGKTTGRAS
jgi:CelD/BcsL family acetyltransferase involved in cellulose biosynthesis